MDWVSIIAAGDVDWLSTIVSWVIVGALAGAAIGGIFKKAQFGLFAKLGIGMVGAAISGGLFHVAGIDLGLGDIQVTLENLIAAFVGAAILLIVVWIVRKKKAA